MALPDQRSRFEVRTCPSAHSGPKKRKRAPVCNEDVRRTARAVLSRTLSRRRRKQTCGVINSPKAKNIWVAYFFPSGGPRGAAGTGRYYVTSKWAASAAGNPSSCRSYGLQPVRSAVPNHPLYIGLQPTVHMALPSSGTQHASPDDMRSPPCRRCIPNDGFLIIIIRKKNHQKKISTGGFPRESIA